jgi:ubiquinone/menaquinone biosynthesis C-methylase UbiE
MQRRDDDRVESEAIAALVPLEGKRVLEVGCGKGRLTALAAGRAPFRKENKPSDGLEPSTPSLPWRCSTN